MTAHRQRRSSSLTPRDPHPAFLIFWAKGIHASKCMQNETSCRPCYCPSTLLPRYSSFIHRHATFLHYAFVQIRKRCSLEPCWVSQFLGYMACPVNRTFWWRIKHPPLQGPQICSRTQSLPSQTHAEFQPLTLSLGSVTVCKALCFTNGFKCCCQIQLLLGSSPHQHLGLCMHLISGSLPISICNVFKNFKLTLKT